MDHPFLRAMDRLYLTCIWVAGTAIFFMSLIIPWGVFTRYMLGTGSQWPEPIAILLMMVAQVSDMHAGELVHMIADAHIYDRHVDIVRELEAARIPTKSGLLTWTPATIRGVLLRDERLRMAA